MLSSCYVPQKALFSYTEISNSISFPSNSISFIPLFYDLLVALLLLHLRQPAIIVYSPLLRNIFNEKHWKLASIVFMVAKLGNIFFGSKILCLGRKNVFDLKHNHFFISEQQNVFPPQMFPTRLNWETIASATMFPSLDRQRRAVTIAMNVTFIPR